MLREIENIYIETYSAWEKYRKSIMYKALAVVIASLVISIFNFGVGEVIFAITILILIGFGIYARQKDFQDVKKRSAKNKFNNYDYKRVKFEQMKDKVKVLLKEKNMYNKESLELIRHAFERHIIKYDKTSIIASILSIILAIIALKLEVAAVVIVLFAAMGLGLLIALLLEWILKYILVNKVKYEELVDALLEIELEVINTRKRKGKNIENINKREIALNKNN